MEAVFDRIDEKLNIVETKIKNIYTSPIIIVETKFDIFT